MPPALRTAPRSSTCSLSWSRRPGNSRGRPGRCPGRRTTGRPGSAGSAREPSHGHLCGSGSEAAESTQRRPAPPALRKARPIAFSRRVRHDTHLMTLPTSPLRSPLLSALLLAPPALAQVPASPVAAPGITGSGTVVIERDPEIMRLQVSLLATGKTMKDALAALRLRRDSTKQTVTTLGADVASIRTE